MTDIPYRIGRAASRFHPPEYRWLERPSTVPPKTGFAGLSLTTADVVIVSANRHKNNHEQLLQAIRRGYRPPQFRDTDAPVIDAPEPLGPVLPFAAVGVQMGDGDKTLWYIETRYVKTGAAPLPELLSMEGASTVGPQEITPSLVLALGDLANRMALPPEQTIFRIDWYVPGDGAEKISFRLAALNDDLRLSSAGVARGEF